MTFFITAGYSAIAATFVQYVSYTIGTRGATTTPVTVRFVSNTQPGEGVMGQARYVVDPSPTPQYTGFVAGTYAGDAGNGNSYFDVVLQIPNNASNVTFEGANAPYGATSPGSNYTGFSATPQIASMEQALPVQWADFVVAAEGSTARMQWGTFAEIDNVAFEVQRSTNSNTWEVVGRLNGKGTTSVRQQYSFIDAAPNQGLNYYRLRQIDANGKSSLSRVRSVVIGNAVEVLAGPNPAVRYLNLRNVSEKTELVLMDAQGRQQLRRTLTQDAAIGLDNLNAGVYMLRMTNTRGTATSRLVVQR